jgi:hypothetical protein
VVTCKATTSILAPGFFPSNSFLLHFVVGDRESSL